MASSMSRPRMYWRHLHPQSFIGFCLLSFRLLPRIHAAQVNVTIDDQGGDPTTGQSIQYNPPEAWSIGQDCTQCTAKPRPISNAFGSTWMDATYFPSGTGSGVVSGQLVTASVPFIGSAVYVQVITTGSTDFPAGNSDFTFYLDGINVGSLQKPADGDTSYKWNQTIFATNNLTNSLHTLTIEVGRANNESLFLLDSIIYTKEVTDSSSSVNANPSTTSASSSAESDSSSTHIGIIIGPVVGAVAVVAALLAFLFFLRRRRNGQKGRDLLESPNVRSAPQTSGGTSRSLEVSNPVMGHIDPFIFPIPSGTPYQDSVGEVTRVLSVDAQGAASSNNTGSQPSSSSRLAMAQAGYGSSGHVGTDDEAGPSATLLAAPPAYSEVAESRPRRPVRPEKRTFGALSLRR